jgi:hypothetical protein
MSKHPIEQDELMAYLDGELEVRRAAEAASHLKQCQECQKLAAELQEVSQMLMSWRVQETEPEPGEPLISALETREKEKPSGIGRDRKLLTSFLKGRRLMWAGGLAALALLIFGISISTFVRFASAPKLMTDTRRTDSSQATYKTEQPGGLMSAHRAVKTKLPAAPQPSATPMPSADSVGDSADVTDQEDQETSDNVPGNAPMIIRTADLGVVVKEFEKARLSVDEILRRHHGHVGELNVNNPTGAARSLSGTLRIPGNQLDAALNDLKALGRVDKETLGGEEVTQQYIDLQARLSNARHTEQRLIEIQRERTGKLSDVLAVEMQISRVRGQIEQMEAERKNMKNQVDFATLNLSVVEDYKAELKVSPPSTGTQFRNAAIEGFESLANGIILVLLWLLSVGPTLLLWVAILFFPVRWLWRKVRARLTASS